jgi:hypothetical protein
MASQNAPEQTTITLDHKNSCQILKDYVELAQQKGAFELSEAEVLKRASDYLLNDATDAELNQINARQLLIQGVTKGQRHGAYSLSDAALIHKVVTFVSKAIENTMEYTRQMNAPQAAAPAPAPAPAPVPAPAAKEADLKPKGKAKAKAKGKVKGSKDEDLSELADPIPLRPKQI